jgi:hypothetical protein
MEGISHAYDDNVVLIDPPARRARPEGGLHRPERQREDNAAAHRGRSTGPAGGVVRWAPKARADTMTSTRTRRWTARTVLEEAASVAPEEPEVKLRTVLGSSCSAATTSSRRSISYQAGNGAVWRWPSSCSSHQRAHPGRPTNHLDRSTRRKLLDVLRNTKAPSCAPRTTGILDRVATRVYEVKDGAVRELTERRKTSGL